MKKKRIDGGLELVEKLPVSFEILS